MGVIGTVLGQWRDEPVIIRAHTGKGMKKEAYDKLFSPHVLKLDNKGNILFYEMLKILVYFFTQN